MPLQVTERKQKETHIPGTLLLVDDDTILRTSLSKMLRKLGYNVVQAENGQEALDTLRTQAFDLVITDLKMPIADGRFLLKKMSEHFNTIPRIVLTAHENDDDLLLALHTGAYDFIKKPIFDYNLLNHSIQRALEKKIMQDERINTFSLLEHLNEVISMLNRGKEVEEIFQMLYISLQDLIPFNRIALLDYNSDDKILSVKLSESDREVFLKKGDDIHLSAEFFQSISKKTDIIIIKDLELFFQQHSLGHYGDMLLQEELQSAALIPLIINDRNRGFLALLSEFDDAYTKEHIRFLTLLAGHIAIALERGELLDELALHTKNLEKLVKVRTHEVLKTQKTTIFALSKLAEIRDNETGEHLDRMRNYSVLLAQLLKYTGEYPRITNEFLKNIYDSSILHDVGKVGIPDAVLLKPSSLTDNEFEVMKTHTTIGYNALNDASQGLGEDSFLHMAKNIALYHHERFDGKGYPCGIKGEEIPLSARIVTVCDIYDALTTDRPYKRAFSHDKAIFILEEEFYRFDPRILKVFLENKHEFDRIRHQFS